MTLLELSKKFNIDLVEPFGSTNDIHGFLAKARNETGREGYVIRFADGHMIKVKNDWYVTIHKIKEKILLDKNVIDLVISNEIDDLIPFLTEGDYERVKGLEESFREAYHVKIVELEELAKKAWSMAGEDRKTLAVEVMPKLGITGFDQQIVFRYAAGHTDISSMVLELVKKYLNKRYDDLKEWLGME